MILICYFSFIGEGAVHDTVAPMNPYSRAHRVLLFLKSTTAVEEEGCF